jgi:putative sugar O-methyltransferase
MSAFIYRLYVAMLWDFVARQDSLDLLRALKEPEMGNPFLVQYKGRWTSQDLCNSVHEFYSAGGQEGVDKPEWNVVELGAGYGRLGYVFLKALPASTYCIIDIPPALNIAEHYLTSIFPEERIFRFRPFKQYEGIEEEFKASRIRFLAAHQIEMLPDKQFDLFVNISSLHEMSYAQIVNYLAQIDRLCRGKFYTKQWRVSRAAVNGFIIRESEYPIPGSWETLYHRRHPIQRMFFEALYQIGAGPSA